jgi:hypothetical protein
LIAICSYPQYCDGDNWMMSFFDYECIAEECQDVGVPELIATCSYPQICDAGYGGCTTPACWVDEDCGEESWSGHFSCNANDIDIMQTKYVPICTGGGSAESICSLVESEPYLTETCPEKCRSPLSDDAICTFWGRPDIFINFPLDTNYSENISELNYTAVYNDYCEDGDNQCFSPPLQEFDCWYSTDNGITNSSVFDAGINFTGLSSVFGNNTWYVFCNITILNEIEEPISFENFSRIIFFMETPEIPEEPTPEPNNLSDNPLYSIMNSAGAGLGIFLIFMGQALPVLLIVLGFVGIVVVIGMGIAKVITASAKHGGKRR